MIEDLLANYLSETGVIGLLAILTWAWMTRRIITKGELDSMIEDRNWHRNRNSRLEQQTHRAVRTGEEIADSIFTIEGE